MKKLYFLSVLMIFSACKQNEKIEASVKELSIAQKIANAHGFQNWNKVKTFAFTFGGKIEDSSSGRSWIWNPKTNDIQLTRNNENSNYNRNSMDSLALKSDRGFINDKFWALIPFQLVWDEGTTISDVEKLISPVKEEKLNRITVLYSDKGGYTPGDAYDIYFDDNYIIREWSFRRGNTPEPTISNTFENYNNYNGLKVAQDHKRKESDRNLLIRNVKVILED